MHTRNPDTNWTKETPWLTGKTDRTPTSHNPHSSSLHHQVTKVHLPHGPKQANTNCVTFSRTSSTMLADVENTCHYQRRSVYKVYRMRTTEKHKNQETDLSSKWHLIGVFFQTSHSAARIVKTNLQNVFKEYSIREYACFLVFVFSPVYSKKLVCSLWSEKAISVRVIIAETDLMDSWMH